MSETKTIEGTWEGVPYRGPKIDLKSTDNIESMLKLNQKLHVKRFDLSDAEELKGYEEVCQQINDGHAQLSYEKMEYDETARQWVVLLRWIEWWYSPAEGAEK